MDGTGHIISQNIPAPGPGRPKGSRNKTTRLLKEALLIAAENAGGGGKGGLVAYLTQQAIECPSAFLALLGKVLPLQGQGDPEKSVAVTGITVRYVAAKAESA